MHRYLAILWDAGDPQGLHLSQSFRAAIQSRSADWCIDYDGPGAMVVHALLPARATHRYELTTDAGVVIGRLFHNIGGSSEPLSSAARCATSSKPAWPAAAWAPPRKRCAIC